MTESNPKNVYQRGDELDAERERLRTFDVPTKASIAAIGELAPGQLVLDIGAGENPGLEEHVQNQGANYIALDFRHEPMAERAASGTMAVRADAKHLPIAESVADATHARFVLAHFPDEDDRGEIVVEALQALKPGGKAVFIDYDWTALHGSDAMNRLRDFTLQNVQGFNPGYGANSKSEIAGFVADQAAAVEEMRMSPPRLFDYGPAISIRQVTLQGLMNYGAAQEIIDEANKIFDDIEAEAQMDNPPGYHMPDMVSVVVTKSTE